MFDYVGKKIVHALAKLRGKGVLTEADVVSVLRDIRVSLLEADVALPVAKALVDTVREKACGAQVLQSLTPEHTIVKIVHDELLSLLSHENIAFTFSSKGVTTILMVGLQGSGKTTMCGKIGHYLHKTLQKKVLLTSVDVYRPAAQKQLEILAQSGGLESVPIIEGEHPMDIVRRSQKMAVQGGYDVLLVDTAGRLHMDDELMKELETLCKVGSPRDVLFVADALLGQDAVKTATAFAERIPLTGVCLSRIDGDGRGGAALSVTYVTKLPIKFMGTGERPSQGMVYDPRRIADGILDKGDMVALAEKAMEVVSQEDTMRLMDRLSRGIFTLEDLRKQLRSMEKMGGVSRFLSFLPGMRALSDKMGDTLKNAHFKKQIAIIDSMTPKERRDPTLLHASRKKRIALGSGTSSADVNRLLEHFEQIRGMMKKMKKGGMGSLLPPMS